MALVLFSLGALFSLYEGIEKLLHPHQFEDPLVAFVVLGVALVLAVEMKSLLIGESAGSDVDRSIRTAIESSPDVRRMIHLRTLQLGPEDLLVAAKVDLGATDVAGLAEAIDRVEVRVRDAVPTARLIYVEPDLYRTEPAG